MKCFVCGFLRRGTFTCGLGPIILGILYIILRQMNVIDEILTIRQVCIGIFSLAALAFVAGGMNAIYQIESLPLMIAVLIHGVVLYAGYLATYLLNDWLEAGTLPIFVFTAIFVVGYFVIWGIIYTIIKRNAKIINKKMKEQV